MMSQMRLGTLELGDITQLFQQIIDKYATEYGYYNTTKFSNSLHNMGHDLGLFKNRKNYPPNRDAVLWVLKQLEHARGIMKSVEDEDEWFGGMPTTKKQVAGFIKFQKTKGLDTLKKIFKYQKYNNIPPELKNLLQNSQKGININKIKKCRKNSQSFSIN